MEEKHNIHMIGNAHIDPVWLWQWQEGFAEIKATFRSALDRMNEFPEFIFTCACAAYYKWVEENAPEMFREIQTRVREGRWRVVGGMWIQPDCNIPSGESFARHFLISQRYFKEKFGVTANSGYNVDSFGHNGSMPKLFNAAGIQNYVMMRPSLAENPDVPGWSFWWESDDGSRVLTYRIPNSYTNAIWGGGRAFGKGYETPEALEAVKIADETGLPVMHFYGVGNHGGGPTIKSLEILENLRKAPGGGRIMFSSPDMYFNELRELPGLPVWRGDLQHHASLCYSANSEIKRNNRRAENRLASAEKYVALAVALAGYEPSAGRLDKAWSNVLFNQFHDIMGGCSIKEAYDDAREVHGEALNIAAEVQNAATQSISWAIGTADEKRVYCSKDEDWSFWSHGSLGTPVVVFNPLAWSRQVPVRVGRPVARVTDENGADRPVQRVRASRTNRADKWDGLFMAEVPAMGWRTYWAYLGETSSSEPTSLISGDSFIENERLRLEAEADTGYIKSLYDKYNGRGVFTGPAAAPLVIDVEHADTWGHGVFSFRDVAGRFGNAKVTLIESGPVRAVLRSESVYGGSALRQDFILYAGAGQIEVQVRLDWREKFKLLKLSFPIDVNGEVTAVYDIPFGHIERPADGREESGQLWFGAGDGGYGVAIINNGKYAFDVLQNDMRMTVANGSMFADHYGQKDRDGLSEFLDQGVQEFSYVILPYAGGWRSSGAVKAAVAHNTEGTRIAETYHKGRLPQSYRGIDVSASNIIVTAVKPAEDGDGVIVRAYESEGKHTGCEINLIFLDRQVKASFTPYSVKSFHVSRDGDCAECNFIEE